MNEETTAEPRRALDDSAARAPRVDPEWPVVAGYDLVRVIGRGGMGVVWEAFEHRFERSVALKVHHSYYAGDADGLWSEAFVAARIGDPGIVGVLDVGTTLDGRPYYAMELVAGSDLATLIAEGKIAPRRAVGIAADIARAAGAAHDRGVIHRDLKPRNVILDATGRARVVDFGIAFVADGTPDRFAGQVAGSPSYMSPEQVLGIPVTPASDVFAIGVILYEMLTGERPFHGTTPKELYRAVVSEVPRLLADKTSDLQGDVEAVVRRCLAKDAAERYANGRVLFEVLSALADGRPLEPTQRATYAPRATTSLRPAADRPRRDDAKKHFVWKWRLTASPAALWPHVANTDRLNKSVGAGPVAFTDEATEGGGVERSGEQRVLGMSIKWREFPFEWVKEREHSVFRWYRSGPIAALWNKVTLTPLEGGGTELTHELWVTPRGVVGQVASYVEIERKLAPGFDRFYRNLDAALASAADPFDVPHQPSDAARALARRVEERLVGEGFDRRIIETLAHHVLTAPDALVRVLRPFELAEKWRVDRGAVLDAFVHAAHEGLLEPTWDVVCPRCNLPHESHGALAGVRRVGTCKACASTFERDLRDCVELVFSPHPAVRTVDRETYCLGAPALRPHILAQQILDPGAERTVTVDLPRGHYRITTAFATEPWELVASAVGFATTVEIDADPQRIVGTPDLVQAGPVTFVFRNATNREETFRVEIAGGRTDAVSASAALTHPSFRSLFSDQLLAQGEHIRVSHLAFVFVGLLDRQALYERLGDAAACEIVTHIDSLAAATAREHEGTLVPSSLDLLVIALPSAVRALDVARSLRERIDAANLDANVALAIHDGRCIALTRDATAEFFGETLHRGQALLVDCPLGGIALSASVAADRGVTLAAHEAGFSLIAATTRAGPYQGRRVIQATREVRASGHMTGRR